MSRWNAFYANSESRGPSALLSRASSLVITSADIPQAIDLGCGTGKEAQQLLQAGWNVLAIDNEPEAIARTIANCAASSPGELATLLCDFERLVELPRSQLIHAGLALPFCQPARFEQLWHLVLSALEPGGVFVGHFFGVNHAWSTLAHLSFHTEPRIRQLCEGLDIILLRESETPSHTPSGHLNWHRFDVIARKPIEKPSPSVAAAQA